ncbi:MAG: hypothetical protein B6D41_19085 [Chloroflexi bacterium UTCFX4]|jgi:hypothetical protein|nr:MAG: hypothetical protein B6D41_19085 [Chloroflexi bacterium UTCFX4]
MKTPSEELARKILERLVAEKLVLAEDVKHLLPKLADGKMKGADWRLALEKGDVTGFQKPVTSVTSMEANQ